MPPPTLIGLTGGIACGKSTVAAMLAARGARVVDADAVAREVVAPGTEGLTEVLAAFGADGLLGPDGALDRKALAARVFEDEGARRRLEAILHPRIAATSRSRLAEAQAARPPLVVYDAALLVEAGRADDIRPLVVVVADHATQIARLLARDGLSPEAAEARLAAQMPVAEKAARADYVIDNGGALAATEAQVASLWRELTGADGR